MRTNSSRNVSAAFLPRQHGRQRSPAEHGLGQEAVADEPRAEKQEQADTVQRQKSNRQAFMAEERVHVRRPPSRKRRATNIRT